MRFKKPVLKLALDEGVPDSVASALRGAGHKVMLLNKMLPRGSKDQLVCEFALTNGAILVAIDGDMKRIARGHGIGANRYRKLNLLSSHVEKRALLSASKKHSPSSSMNGTAALDQKEGEYS